MTESTFEEKSYEATFDVVMPGQVKASVYKIKITAHEPVEATAKAIAAWKDQTEPRDIRVREITKGSA